MENKTEKLYIYITTKSNIIPNDEYDHVLTYIDFTNPNWYNKIKDDGYIKEYNLLKPYKDNWRKAIQKLRNAKLSKRYDFIVEDTPDSRKYRNVLNKLDEVETLLKRSITKEAVAPDGFDFNIDLGNELIQKIEDFRKEIIYTISKYK